MIDTLPKYQPEYNIKKYVSKQLIHRSRVLFRPILAYSRQASFTKEAYVMNQNIVPIHKIHYVFQGT